MKRLFKGPIFIALTIVFSLLAIVGAYRYRHSQEATVYSSSTGSTTPLTILAENISDEDWQELLNRVGETQNSTNTAPLSNSDVISREIFAQFVYTKQQGKNITPEQAKLIANDLIKYADSIDVPLKQYTPADIKVVKNPTQNDIVTYRNQLNSIVFSEKQEIGNELVIMQEAVVDNNLENMSKLKGISDFYNKIAFQLLAVSAPAPIAQEHLDIVNLYLRIAKDVKSFDKLKNDPIIAAKNFGDYSNADLALFKTFQKIMVYFESQGVDF